MATVSLGSRPNAPNFLSKWNRRIKAVVPDESWDPPSRLAVKGAEGVTLAHPIQVSVECPLGLHRPGPGVGPPPSRASLRPRLDVNIN